jgi:hypothetical protein
VGTGEGGGIRLFKAKTMNEVDAGRERTKVYSKGIFINLLPVYQGLFKSIFKPPSCFAFGCE